MDGTASAAHLRRRWITWILWSVVGVCLLALVAVVLWLGLPRWAPDLVLRHSPIVEPVLRAMATKLTRSSRVNVANSQLFTERLKGWGLGAVPGVIAALASSDQAVRLAAVVAANHLSRHHPLPPALVAALCRHARDEADGDARALATHALRAVDEPRVRRVLLAGLGDPHDLVRQAAVIGVGKAMPHDAEVGAALLTLIGDPASGVRSRAIDLLVSGKHPLVADALGAALATVRDPGIAATQAAALGRIGDRRAVPALARIAGLPATSIDEAALVEAALKALAEIDRAEALPIWVAALGHAHPRVRFAAVSGSAGFAEPGLRPHLVALLGDPDALVRAETVCALAGTRDQRVVDAVLDAYDRGCCAGGDLDGAHLGLNNHERPHSKVLEAIDGLPFTEAQRKRWDALRAK